MKYFIFLVALFAVFVGAAHGQVRKCTGPDGKITYSDFVCGSTTARESNVTVNNNTLESSAIRREAERFREEDAVETALLEQSGKCRFSHFLVGDSLGKSLAAEAKQECLGNIKAKTLGKPTSMDAYNRWKDHSSQKSASRQADATRAANADNARAIANSNQDAVNKISRQIDNKTYKCTPTYGAALDCR